MNEQLKTQVLEQLKSANNVLVAVSSNPTVDELSASIALTLLLNKMNKHATTVFSGVVPSTLEFLQPEKTIETTTDSLRDFIIALDKSKADKLRYKVEDDVVRIFITPYRTSISDKDLEFSQGDFNVDVVIALGVTKREDLDRAITSHGRILHDATVLSLTKREMTSELGSMNWQEPHASSLCEMVSVLSLELDRQAIDGQMATALMTGIIAETDRFRNDKTTPLALSLSSQLMSAGANQQLIAEKLEEPAPEPEPIPEAPTAIPVQPALAQVPPAPLVEEIQDDGSLEIDHEEDVEKIHIDENGNLSPDEEDLPLPPVEQKPAYTGEEESEKRNLKTDADSQSFAAPVAPEPLPPQTPEAQPQTDQPSQNDTTPLVSNEEEQKPQENENRDLDTPTESQDNNDSPAVPAIEHAIPTMTHGKKIMPPSHGDNPVSDKPFDLQEALKNEIAKEETSTGMLPPVEQPTPPASAVPQPLTPEPMSTMPVPPQPAKDETLLALERAIDSPHVKDMTSSTATPPQTVAPSQGLEDMRDAVAKAADAVVSPFPSPSKSLGAQPVGMDLHPTTPSVYTPKVIDPNAAPAVPPPMPLSPQFYDENGKTHTPLNS